ncbi:hypothetical protein EST38_g8783 [Candolleomyces aberdarensis]|uniref:Mucoidy inhibitor A n=1 Tax=Candolleomyces aberdarensis TaxID=2316362 RepID=A0A4Q2DDT3_9AGAR|nr:hypothetical protein EST38_g8783 [Candolleomyces aberdarensis]
MTTAPVGNPPPFEQHVVQLESAVDSKITGVSIYSDRAEVNRVVRFSVKRGQNQAIISGLPNALNHDSLRVEGKGAGTIQDVTISQDKPKAIANPPELKTSPELKKLLSNKKDLEQAIYRNAQAQTTLDKYLGSLSSQQTPSSKLSEIFSDYDAVLSDLQKKKTGLSEELEDVEKAIIEEQSKLQAAVGEQKKWNPNVSLIVTVGIFANDDGDVELGLVYAVKRTSWTARYDIRVNTQTKEKAVSLVYKASIKQSSGEDWTDVPLTLETATPSFDKTLPNLNPWTIGIYRPPLLQPLMYSGSSAMLRAAPTAKERRRAASAMLDEVHEAISAPRAAPPPLPEMSVQTSAVTSKGGVSATFAVPGLITIPSDGADHGVTIATLELDAKMSWVSIPKKDTKTYLSAKIKNASEYTLLSGPANVYVDGSFISRSTIPGVSPEEKFECALGLDPAIRITYHPLSKKLSQSGLLSKSDVYLYTQRITVHNTKPTLVETIKIIDQIPVSEDSVINVKLLSPALQLPSSNTTAVSPPPNDGASVKSGKVGGLLGSLGSGSSNSTSGNSEKALKAVAKSVKVSSDVVAQWDRPGSDAAPATEEGPDSDSEPVDLKALGKDGKISWLCSVPAQTKTNLTLQWEVSAPVNTNIAGI